MFEELFGALTGKWGIAALVLLALPASRKAVRTVAREAVRAGIAVGEGAKDLYAELKEEASDVVAEVKAERHQNHAKPTAHKSHD
ncbi:MAG: DUF5132 domain-containing protein [Candidatus Obscuribacterales bacterium]|jgi:hypothetical protein|nr:DUF5132 domain-containing protein [Candidatus Obscuribacterales bacterium]